MCTGRARDRIPGMRNPWLDIPLADYEGHMALPEVGQAKLLADIFATALRDYQPPSIAVIGCAGGNGFDRIDPDVTTRVVGVDLNARYLQRTRQRFSGKFQALNLVHANIEHDILPSQPVRLIFAALVLEYVDVVKTLPRIRAMLEEGGILITVVQMPSAIVPAVTPSPFTSLKTVEPIMRWVKPSALRATAKDSGLSEIHSKTYRTPAGKEFQQQTFRFAA
jgi:ubiquinone/menaquinone biosynthesis C-methylase UbiE